MPRKKYTKIYVPLEATPKVKVCKYPGRRITSWGSNCYKASQASIHYKSNRLTRKVLFPYTWNMGGASWFDKNGMIAIHLWGLPILSTGETTLIKMPLIGLCKFIDSLMQLVPLYTTVADSHYKKVAEDHEIYKHAFYSWAEKKLRSVDRNPNKRKNLCDRVYDLKERKDRQRFQEYNVWGNRPYPKSMTHRRFAKLFRIYNQVGFNGKKLTEDNNELV